MTYALLVKWDKNIHGSLSTEPDKYMSTKYLVIDKYVIDSTDSNRNINDLIYFAKFAKVNNGARKPINPIFICPIKNDYIYLSRTFANLNYPFLKFVTLLKEKYSRTILIKKDPWSYRFREIRGRFPDYNEYKKATFV